MLRTRVGTECPTPWLVALLGNSRCLFSASPMGPLASLKFPIIIIGVEGAIKSVFDKVGQ